MRLTKELVARWSLILLCFSMAAAVGGGLFESIVLAPLWSKAPPSSFSIIQRGTGVPLQRFWIPVQLAITLFIILALVMTWREPTVRRLLLVALVSYAVMRVWSGLFFIPEMNVDCHVGCHRRRGLVRGRGDIRHSGSARLECGQALAIKEFGPSYRRAAVMQGMLAVVGLLASLLAWYQSSDVGWLVGGLLLGLLVPFTLVVILPTNRRLLDSRLDNESSEARELLARWGRLHAVRTVVSVAVFVAFAGMSLRS